jgi:vacuolar-type H+-ATPase subunit E/Vma4
MSLQDISRDIQSKADFSKQEIEDSANETIKSLESEFEQNFAKHKQIVLDKHNAESNIITSKLSSKYSKISKELELDAKTKILNTVKSNALSEVLKLSKSDREKLIKNLFSLAKKLIKYDVIFTSNSDLVFVKSLVTKEIEVKVISDIHGLVFETSSGLEKLDLTFENLFNDTMSENEAQLQNILFK